MAVQTQTKYDVGGVLLDRPFKIQRLGHFGFNLVNQEEGIRFYTELLGFKITDMMNWAERLPDPSMAEGLGNTYGVFTRYGGDHHAFVMFPQRVLEKMPNRRARPGVTINQITWQVGSLAEVGAAIDYFGEHGVPLQRSGRDMPGSNWHTYIFDPDGHTNELYYGIEQIGWNGHSKPRVMYNRRFAERPELPQINEFEEVQQALQDGVDLTSGYRYLDPRPAKYDVQGILLPRPFKITRIGPVGLFVQDVAASEAFYRDELGFEVTEESRVRGERCVFLRTNTEHHSLALYPIELREELGFSPHTTSAAFGVQLANYRQLRDAVDFLREHGVTVKTDLPVELHPGVDYAAYAVDPDGHHVMLYYYMEQLGWDGRPRPASERRRVDVHNWPATLEPLSDTFKGEPFLGPWG